MISLCSILSGGCCYVGQDLITLPHLHEPAILHSLWERFYHGDIYTFTGPILIAVNPFKRLPLYTEEKLMTYYEHGLLATQGTHILFVFFAAHVSIHRLGIAARLRPYCGRGEGHQGAGREEAPIDQSMHHLNSTSSCI